MDKKGIFIVIEGVEGAGKTTFTKILSEMLRNIYPDRGVSTPRSPAGSIRELLLNRPEKFCANTEALLYLASHANVTELEIEPALDRGDIVIVDRYLDSFRAFQIAGRGLDRIGRAFEMMDESGVFLKPDITIYLIADEEVCNARIAARKAGDFMELEEQEYKDRVAKAMREIGSKNILMERQSVGLINNSDEENLRRNTEAVVVLLKKQGVLP